MDLTTLTIDAARTAVQERKTTATALAEDFYSKIGADDPKIGAYLTLCRDRALAKAAEMDALAAKGEKLPPLGGVPVGIKDVMVTRGVRSTAGSKILGNYIPPYDCTAVIGRNVVAKNLRAGGAAHTAGDHHILDSTGTPPSGGSFSPFAASISAALARARSLHRVR